MGRARRRLRARPRAAGAPTPLVVTFVFKAAVVGAGATGGEIVQAIANAGVPVVLAEPGAYEGFGDVDFVIVAVRERMDLMETVFAELDDVMPGHAIIASATDLPVVTELGDAAGRPDRVVGFHFLRPVAATRVVEIVEGEYTSPETVQTAMRFAQAIRRMPIVCGEAPGFVVTRILAAGAADAWRVQHELGADRAEVDRIIVDAGVCPVGPFMLADRLGLDAILRVIESLRESYGERFYVHPSLPDLVEGGDLGVASGRGFYAHP